MKFFFLIFYFIIPVLAISDVNAQNCFSKSQKESLIKEILCQKTIFQYLHINNPKRTPIKLRSNSFIPDTLDIVFNSKKIIIDKKNYEDQIELIFEEHSSNEDCEIKFGFISKIEGVTIEGIAIKKNIDWKIKITKHIEI